MAEININIFPWNVSKAGEHFYFWLISGNSDLSVYFWSGCGFNNISQTHVRKWISHSLCRFPLAWRFGMRSRTLISSPFGGRRQFCSLHKYWFFQIKIECSLIIIWTSFSFSLAQGLNISLAYLDGFLNPSKYQN